MLNEKDILGMQLIRRSDELSQLYEEIKIAEVEAKIDVCKQKLREVKLAQGEQADLRGVIHVLERELISERTKVKALPEKLERPMNVHRWRKLAGSDPKRFTVMEKIQVLQKRLINRIEEDTMKNLSNEMNVFKANARRMREMLGALEVDRKKYVKECAEANH